MVVAFPGKGVTIFERSGIIVQPSTRRNIMDNSITIQVLKGTKVNVQEVGSVKDSDPRVPDDRNVIIHAPKEMKVAIKSVDSKLANAKASVVLTCG
jgi:hypothetical protein